MTNRNVNENLVENLSSFIILTRVFDLKKSKDLLVRIRKKCHLYSPDLKTNLHLTLHVHVVQLYTIRLASGGRRGVIYNRCVSMGAPLKDAPVLESVF